MVIDFRNLSTSSVKSTSELFKDLARLKSLNLSDFDTSKVKDMSYMFSGCINLGAI